MAKQERLYSAAEGALMTRAALATFRARASKLGIKGRRDGKKVYYTRAQLEDIYNGKASRKVNALPAKNAKAKKATARRAERKAKGKEESSPKGCSLARHLPASIFFLVSPATALTTTLTASSIGSLKGTSIRSSPFW